MKKSLLLITPILVVLCMTQEACARKKPRPYKCPVMPEEDIEAQTLAGDLFAEGENLSKKNKFELALKKFLCSATVRDHVNTHFNIAQAARYMKRKRRLLRLFEYFVEQNPDSHAAKEISKLIEIIKEQLAK